MNRRVTHTQNLSMTKKYFNSHRLTKKYKLLGLLFHSNACICAVEGSGKVKH